MHSAIEDVEMWGTGKGHMVLEFQAILCCEMFSTWVYNRMDVISTVAESAQKESPHMYGSRVGV
jgi:hypothetical protein